MSTTGRPSLWKAAVEQLARDEPTLSDELDKVRAHLGTQKPEDLVQLLVNTVANRRDALENKRWSFKFRGRARKVRDCLNTVLKGVKAVQEVGSALASLEPVYAGIPWACVNVILNFTLGNFEQHEAVLQVMAVLAPIIARYTRIEAIYVGKESMSLKADFEKCLVDLYTKIIILEVRMARFYGSSSARRVLGATVHENDWVGMLNEVRLQDSSCLEFTVIFEAEYAETRHLELKALLREQDEQIERALDLLEKSAALSAYQRDMDILSWISAMSPGNDHETVLEKTKMDTVFSQSGQWLFSHENYKDWSRLEGSHPLLWIRGSIGTGKTSLMSLVVERELDRSHLEEEERVGFFYCTREKGKAEGTHTKDVIRGLLRQLAFDKDDRHIVDEIQCAYDEGRKQGEYLSEGLCMDLLETVISPYKRTTIIIDALDESANWEDLLVNMKQINDRCGGRVKFCVSSRHEVVVPGIFPDYYLVEAQVADTFDDLQSFVEYRVRGTQPHLLSQGPKDLEDRLIRALCEGGQGMFKLVDLHLSVLFHVRAPRRTPATVEKYLRQLSKNMGHTGLDDQYEAVYNLNTEPDSDDRSLSRKCYRLMLCCQRPLSVDELVAAVGLEPDQDFDTTVTATYLLDTTANFLVVGVDNVVQFTHLSAREYLQRKHAIDYVTPRCHLEAATTCLTAFQGLPPVRGWGPASMTNEQYWQEQGVAHYAFIKYALGAWPIHCLAAGHEAATGQALQHLLDHFLEPGDESSPFYQWNHYFSRSDSKTRWPTEKKRAVAGSNALIVACTWGLDASVRYLLQEYPALSRQHNSFGIYAVHIASLFGHREALAAILDIDSGSVNRIQKPREGATPLHLAAANGHLETMRLLISHGADVHTKLHNGSTALHVAASLDLSPILSVPRSQVDRYALAGRSPIWTVKPEDTTADHINAVELLVSKGASVQAEDRDGRTPLHYAAYAGRVTLGQVLLRHGAPVDYGQGHRAGTALHVSALFGRLDFIRFLLKSGADVRALMGETVTTLHSAVAGAQLEAAELLLDAECDIEARDWEHLTPLLAAVINGYVEMVKLLLRRGANIKAEDKEGRDATTVVRSRMAEAVPRQSFPRVVRLARLKAMPPLRPNWQEMLWVLVREEVKYVMYPTYRGQSEHTSEWL